MQLIIGPQRARHDSRKRVVSEVAVAIIAVLTLHAALTLWLLRNQAPDTSPHEVQHTIVARLLSVPPRPAVTTLPRAAVPMPANAPPPPRQMPEPSGKTAPALQPARQPRTIARHEEAVAPATPSPPLDGTPTTAAPVAAPSTPEPATPPQAMRAPKPVSHVDCTIAQPDYPEAARRRGEAGTAVVRFVIGTDGRIGNVQLQRSSGYPNLDDAALDALHASTCHPYLEAGVPARVVFEQPFVFGLDN